MMPWFDSLPESRGWRLPTYCTCPERLLVVKKVDFCRFCVFFIPFHTCQVLCCCSNPVLNISVSPTPHGWSDTPPPPHF